MHHNDLPNYAREKAQRMVTTLLVSLVVAMLAYGFVAVWRAYADPRITAREIALTVGAE